MYPHTILSGIVSRCYSSVRYPADLYAIYLSDFCMSSSFMPKQKFLGILIAFSLLSLEAHAEERRHTKIWRISAAVLGAVTIADMQSSAGRLEANPLLSSPNGRFGGQGFALKGAGVGAMLGAQWLMLRKNPKAARYAAGANFAVSAL